MSGHLRDRGSGRSSRLVTVATSEHPVAAHAVAECAGALLDESPTGYDSLLCLVGTPFSGALLDMADALGQMLGARDVAGIESHGVLMGGRIAAGTPALAVLAFRGAEVRFSAHDCSLPAGRGPRAGVGPPDHGASLRIVFADPFGFPAGPGNLPGRLPAPPGSRTGRGASVRVASPVASLVGGFIETVPTGAAMRLVLDGAEHRGVALCVTLPSEDVSIIRLSDTNVIGDGMLVTATSDGHIVALDDLPAAEALESLVQSLDLQTAEGVHMVGFTLPDDDRLIAVRRSPVGLATSAPVSVGATLLPSVSSDRAAAESLEQALWTCAARPVLLLTTSQFMLNFPFPDYGDIAPGSGAHIVGARVDGALWGDPEGFEILRPGAVVVCL